MQRTIKKSQPTGKLKTPSNVAHPQNENWLKQTNVAQPEEWELHTQNDKKPLKGSLSNF